VTESYARRLSGEGADHGMEKARVPVEGGVEEEEGEKRKREKSTYSSDICTEILISISQIP
jgi:hypothetical protein